MNYRTYVRVIFALCIVTTVTTACYSLRPSCGGGQTSFAAPRTVQPADVALPAGYKITVVAIGLTFPTSITFDDTGIPYVVESGDSYGEVWAAPRLLKIQQDGALKEVARGMRNGPWTGAVHSKGSFYIAEGGQLGGGRVLRITPEGSITRLIENLHGKGDLHTNGPAIGPEGKIFFGQGTATNAGVVGEDNAKFGWLKRFAEFHDIPCRDVTLAGHNFTSADVVKGTGSRVSTGTFQPFGTPNQAGQVVPGRLPCSGAVMQLSPDGSRLELVAWGFRNPFGLAFAPDGQLYVTDNGYDDRGSRPIWVPAITCGA